MIKRLSQKIKKKEKGSEKSKVPGAAVPYSEPKKDEENDENLATNSSVHSSESGSSSDNHQILDLAAKGDLDAMRQQMKLINYDVNYADSKGNTALIKAATKGHSRIIRYLLLKGADVDWVNKKEKNALYVALEEGHTGSVGVILDYMHSVDSRPRDPFVLVRAVKADGSKYVIDSARYCKDLTGYKKRGCVSVQILVAQNQVSDDMSVFLYSVLDVPVVNAFFIKGGGDMNMKNFQRFEEKNQTKSISILDTYTRSIEAIGYSNLKTLILVACSLNRLVMDGLNSLELLDVRYNTLTSLPSKIKECRNLKTLRISNNNMKRLPKEIGDLSNLIAFEFSYNPIRRLPPHIIKCKNLRVLQGEHTDLIEVPLDIGLLANLEELYLSNNKLAAIPLSVSTMSRLKKISFRANPLQNIPVDFPERADDVKQYLKSLQEDPIPNKTIKLVLVGQEGVGKTTLLKAIKRTLWVVPRTPSTTKTEGIDVKEINVDGINLRCFDCGGDVDFYETHNFFITQGALYLACFNLSEYVVSTVEKSSFLLGRLQLWLQYIFSKVPNAQVVIVGTHADHPSLKRQIFEQIWEQLRILLVNARDHHRQYFNSKSDRLGDCLLCQSDSRCLRKSAGGAGAAGFVNLGFSDTSSLEEETSLNEGPAQVVSFPHIVGYYEVSSVKAVGGNSVISTNNPSIENLKDCIKELAQRMTKSNPDIPRRWSNALKSVQNHLEMKPDDCVSSVEEMSVIASAQGIKEKTELTNMLHFLKAQGHLLFFPKSEDLKDLVILDPEWLAKIFSKVISFRETGITLEGFIDREKLKRAWASLEPNMQNKVIDLLRYFGLSIPTGTNLELFPCKLPLGEPDDKVWPMQPIGRDRQVTYTVVFPGIIPPPFFSDLLVIIYKHHIQKSVAASVGDDDTNTKYYSNHIVDYINLKYHGCKDCTPIKTGSEELIEEKDQAHHIHIELVPHKRTLNITVRGAFPCCAMKKCAKLINKVISKFDGMDEVDLTTIVCPGCQLQANKVPHKYSSTFLAQEPNVSEKMVCSNAHVLTSGREVLVGKIHSSCLPVGTLRAKSKMDELDYTGCPKLFIVLPVNKEGVSFDQDYKLFVQTALFDGFACHLLCEFPDGYHVTRSPGYRIKKPKDFMKMYGSHVIAVLRLLRNIAQSSVVSSPRTRAVMNTIDDILKDITSKFSGTKDLPQDLSGEDLMGMVHERGSRMNRVDLRQFLQLVDKPDYFGPLRRLKYGEQLLWLCNEHYKQMRVLTIGTISEAPTPAAIVESKA